MKILFPIGGEGRKRIVEKLGSGAVLDVACGTGTLLEMADEKGLKWWVEPVLCGRLEMSDCLTLV
jgi:hypothetical protein